MIPSDLRPLGIGEVLDRAVTLFVRHFAVIVFILALVAVPIAIVQYAASPSTGTFFSDIQRVLAVPPGHDAERAAILKGMNDRNRLGALTLLVFVVGGVVEALAATACIIAIGQAYSGRVPSVREVYREALRRWSAQIAALVIMAGLAFAVVVVIVIVVVLAALAIAALAAFSKTAALVVGIPLGLVAIVAYLLAVICMYFISQMALVAVALEEPNPIRGIAHGLRRTLSPAVFWRSAAVGAIVFTVSLIGALLLLSIGATLEALTHIGVLVPVISVVGGLVLNGLVLTFLVLYSFDVRVRREGYDLELASREPAV